MSDSPRASIIINNYNYGRFVGEAIESSLRQTYRNTEVIVVDDGSTDGSREVIRSFGKRVIPVFKANGGQGSAYNVGFARSQGNVVCFLDSDDTVALEAIESAVVLLQEPRVVKVQWPLRVVDAAGSWRGELSTKITPPSGDLLDRLIQDGPIYDFDCTTGAAYRRSFLEIVFPVPEPQYRNGGDVYLITLAPLFGLIVNTDHSLGTYRAHGANNYRDRPLDDEKIRDCLRRFDTNANVLQKAIAVRGLEVDVSLWRQRNFNYLWPQRLLLAKRDIECLIPCGSSYILVNDNEWGSSEPVAGRTSMPLMEHEGEYWGLPSDDDAAIAAIKRLHTAGAAYIVFWWTSFWWFEHYSIFYSWLDSRHPCILANDRLVAFDICRVKPGLSQFPS